jgi:hypothetical protein
MSFKNLPKSYTLSIQLVHCVSIETLFDIILKREPYLNKIDNDNDNDSDIEIEDLGLMTTRHRVSLICPITQSLIVVPAKSAYCSHLTSFDLKAFLQMNERRLQWTCPLCKKSASFESLRVDERLQTILSNVPSNCSTVEIDSSTDCQYILDNIKQEKIDMTDTTHLHRNNQDESNHNSSMRKYQMFNKLSNNYFFLESRHQSDESDCIVLSSGSESEDDDDIDNSPLSASLELDQNDRQVNQINDNTSQSSSHSTHSTPSPIISTVDDGDYWEDLAQITYDLSSDASEKFSNRKRSNSSTSSILSSSSLPRSNDDRHHSKRNKRSSSNKSQTADIDVITLSSNDSSDHDDQLS